MQLEEVQQFEEQDEDEEENPNHQVMISSQTQIGSNISREGEKEQGATNWRSRKEEKEASICFIICD